MKLNQRTVEEKTQAVADKVTRYNWTIKNARGEFLMIDKTELEVDPAYQRNRINQRRVDELCRAWDWIACGCLVVALRDDNKWFVMDGSIGSSPPTSGRTFTICRAWCSRRPTGARRQ